MAISFGCASHAATIDGGLQFNGGAVNYFDPANGYVPATYDNAASPFISAPGVFGFAEARGNTDTAAFTTHSLTIEDKSGANGSFPWKQTFTTSTPGFFDGLKLICDSFPKGVSFTLERRYTLTVDWNGITAPATPADSVAILDFVGGTGSAEIEGTLQFNGGAVNYYDPANGYVPATYDNTASPSIEAPGIFGFVESPGNTDTAAFTTDSLTIEDKSGANGAFPWRQTFTTSAPGSFDGLTLASDTFPNAFSYALTEMETLTVDWGGLVAPAAPADSVALFAFGSSVPEPSTWAMLIVGFLGLGFAGARSARFQRALAGC